MDYSDFDLSEGEPPFNRRRLDAEWIALNAIRETLGIALKGSSTPTYEQSLAFAKHLAPGLFNTSETLIGKTKESQLVQEYRQRTQALSQLENRDVPPTEIIDGEIDILNGLLQAESVNDLIKRRLILLENTRRLLLPKRYTENQLILRDLFKVNRNIPNPPIEGDTYREFQITDDRGLRVRLLHPDPPEYFVGADLIYETYWEKKELIRLAVVQYKIWNGKVLYTSQAENLEKQIEKLKSVFCDTGLCEAYPGSARASAYRLPFCIAFLRPTDELQDPDARLISSGLHIPVCTVLRSWQETGRGGKKIERKNIRSEALSHKVFEEVFNTNMLGSRWMTYSEIEELYHRNKILDPAERMVLHVQEFGI